MIAVRFIRSYRMYQPGEVAGFDDALASRLIKEGFAVDPKESVPTRTETESAGAEEAAKVKAGKAATTEPGKKG